MENDNRPKFDIYTGEPIIYPDEAPKAEEAAVEATPTPEAEAPAVEEPTAEAAAEEIVIEEVASEPESEPRVIEITAEECQGLEAEEKPAETPEAPQTGEYRYVPPYNERTYSPAAPTQQYTAPTPTPTPEKKSKKKKGTTLSFGTGALALLLAAAIILSLGAGFGGAIAYEELIKKDEKPTVVIEDDDDKDEDDSKEQVEKKTSYKVSEDELDAATVADMVASSVVEIEVESELQYGMYQYIVSGAGSGVVVSEDGYVITNAHVIINEQTNEVCSNILVRLNDGTEYNNAEVVGYDEDGDIALLKIDATGLNSATFGDSDDITVAQDVLLIGNPLGQLGGTVTKGIISATSREILISSTKMNLIQVDAAANPGNSGGGLFNMKGELIGILNSGISSDSDGNAIDGIAFCIPSNDVEEIKDELQAHGYVTGKVYVGISFYDVTDVYTAYYYFRSQSTGVYIVDVVEGYNDDVLEYGDRITAIGDTEVTTTTDIGTYLQECSVGDTIKLTVVRNGKVLHVDVECFEYVPTSADTEEEEEEEEGGFIMPGFGGSGSNGNTSSQTPGEPGRN